MRNQGGKKEKGRAKNLPEVKVFKQAAFEIKTFRSHIPLEMS